MAQGIPKYRLSLASVTPDTYTVAVPVQKGGIQNTEPMWTPTIYDPEWVSEWIDRQGTAMPIMRKATERVSFPEGYLDHQHRYYELLPEIQAKITEIAMKARASSGSQTKGDNAIAELERQAKEIEEAGKPFLEWEDIQFRRILYGWQHMTGKHYFYYNFGWIEEVGEDGAGIKALQPTYRSSDNWAWRRVVEAEKSKSGDMWVKRRRYGATWLSVADALYDALFRNGAVLFLTYDQLDAQKYFRRLTFMQDRLPLFLKKRLERNTLTLKIFEPSARISRAMGIPPEREITTSIQSVSTQDEKSVTGGTSSKIIVDEIGEIPNLRQLLAWASPRLAASDGLNRAGVLMLFGTVGSMDKAGPVVQALATNPAVNNHKVALFKGTYAVSMDEFGNDVEDHAYAMIMRKRQDLEDAQFYEELAAFKQKYPLDWPDCWVYSSLDKLMPVRNIAIVREEMMNSEWIKKRSFGVFFRAQDGTVQFKRMTPEPSATKGGYHDDFIGYNQWMIWEHPKPSSMIHPYAMGCDPVDIDKQTGGNPRSRGTAPKSNLRLSDITASIYKRSVDIGGISDFWVAEYQGRPSPLEDAFEQVLLAAEYYGTQINIERNKGGAFLAYANTTGRNHLLLYGGGVAMGLSNQKGDPGYYANDRWWNQMLGHMRSWWIQNTGKPCSPRFMYESERVKEENTDVFVAYAAALQHSIELDLREKSGQQREINANHRPDPGKNWVSRNDLAGKFVNVAVNNPNALTARARIELERRLKNRR